MDRPEGLRVRQRGLGRFDVRDQVWAIIGIGFAHMHFVANPGDTPLGTQPRLQIVG